MVFLATRSFASPPVKPPPEGFVIITTTLIACEGMVTETEKFHWTYFEGTGNLKPVDEGTDVCGSPILTAPGFQEGAEIVYEQDFRAVDGTSSRLRSVAGYGILFEKNFRATSHGIPNLAVRQAIEYNTDPAGSGYATHTEKVGLSVVSCGGGETNPTAGGLLSLCPWGANGSGGETTGYPATNEGIAAGSSFRVKSIRGFTSEARATSTEVPALTYMVDAAAGRGLILAGFMVELWEGAHRWGSHETGVCDAGQYPRGVYAVDDPPAVLSRTGYKEYAAADGQWAFAKKVAYHSTLPGANGQNVVNPLVWIP